VIATGTAATSISTTITISIETTISTVTSTVRDKVIGSTIRNTGETHPMGIDKQPISLAVRLLVVAELETAPVAAPAPVIDLAVVRVLGIDPAAEQALGIDPAVVPELELVQVAVRELGHDRAAAEQERVPVAALQRELVQAEALQRELVQAEALLVPGHPRAQLAAALRTKSVIAAHRPDLVPLLEAGEDLAPAVAETTREPAAAEAVIAWEVADTVAVEAAVVGAGAPTGAADVAAAAVVAVAEDGDKHSMGKNK